MQTSLNERLTRSKGAWKQGRGFGFALPEILLTVFLSVSLGLLCWTVFQRHTLRVRSQEAPLQLRRIAEGFRGAYEEGRSRDKNAASFPHLTSTYTPSDPPCFQGRLRYPASLTPWDNPTWKRLRFDITTPHFYQYRVGTSVTGEHPSFAIEARGDINCNGVFGELKLKGQRSPTSGDLEVFGLFVLNPLE